MRLFIGIPLAPEVINELERISQSLRFGDDGLRWASVESWHITLQFLGETSLETFSYLVPKLREVAFAPFSISLGGLGFFDRAGVFFADVEVSPRLRELQERVVAATAQCGIHAEERPFHPHVTLARARGDNRTRTLRKLRERIARGSKSPPFVARDFLLFEAFLGPGGSRYEIRERFAAALPS